VTASERLVVAHWAPLHEQGHWLQSARSGLTTSAPNLDERYTPITMSTNPRIPLSIRRAVCVSALASMVAACSGVNPSALRRPNSPSELVLAKSVEWIYQEAPFRPITFRGTIASGKYVAEYESSEGTYFRGPPGCFSYEAIAVSASDQRPALGKVFEQPCGLLVPTANAQNKQLYVYLGQVKPRAASTGRSESHDPAAIGSQLALNSPTATGASVAGGAIGGALVGAMIAAEQGNLRVYHQQPPPEILNASIRQLER